MKQIQLQKISKSFGDVQVIPPLDLEIETGEFVVFVGPSGCGKSTLLRLIAGLEDITQGQILINGKEATSIPPAERGLAMVFQSYALYPHMSVRNNIAFPLRMAGISKAEQKKKTCRRGGKNTQSIGISRQASRPAFRGPASACCHRPGNCARTNRLFI